MNDTIEILKRLLKQFPIVKLREYFSIDVTGQDHVIRDILLKSNNINDIFLFSEANFEYCKQHVYVFEYSGVLPSDLKLNDTNYSYSSILNNKNTLTYFLPVSFKVFDLKTSAVINLDFLWPVRVQYYTEPISKTPLILPKTTILEKRLNDNLNDRVNLGKDFDEKKLINKLIIELGSNGVNLEPVDLSKGIKTLLSTDVIDFTSVKFKKAKSVTTETMDEEYTIKQNYTEAYNQIMNSPLEKSTCKFLSKNEDSLPYFRTEPQIGMIGFSLFSPTLISVDNVVNLIINNNF